MKSITRLILVSVTVLTALALVSPLVAPAGQRCSTCHTGSNPSGAYTFKMPSLKALYPEIVPPNTTFTYELKLSNPGMYVVKEPSGTISVEGAGRFMSGEIPSKPLPGIQLSGGSSIASWVVTTGNTTGTMYLNATLKFTAHFHHTTTSENDESVYMLVLYSTVSVRPVALYTTSTDLSLKASSGSSIAFELVSYSDARNITLRPSANIDPIINIVPQFVPSLSPGQRQTFQINVVKSSTVVDNGRIDILWDNITGAKDATYVVVRTIGPGPAPVATSPVWLTGRITGILSLCLLISSVVLGLVKRGGKRRVRVHCAVSWFILGLSVYHGLMLVWGPYKIIWLGNWILLGYVSAAVMGVSSVNGLAQDWMTRKLGYRGWIWLHRITLISAIVLVVIHAILMGTDLKFLRDAIGASGGA